MDLGQGSAHSDILKTVLLPPHRPARIGLCSPLTSNISIQFHQVISAMLEARQQMQDPNACVQGVSQGPAQLENGYQQGKSNQVPPTPPCFGFQLATLACASRLWTRASSANTSAEGPLVLGRSSWHPDALSTECSLWLSRDGTMGVFLGCDTQSLKGAFMCDADFLLVKC